LGSEKTEQSQIQQIVSFTQKLNLVKFENLKRFYNENPSCKNSQKSGTENQFVVWVFHWCCLAMGPPGIKKFDFFGAKQSKTIF